MAPQTEKIAFGKGVLELNLSNPCSAHYQCLDTTTKIAADEFS